MSLAGPQHMRVSWMSTKNAKNSSPIVQYGLMSGNYSFTARGTSLGSYSYLLYESGIMNRVVIGPLQDSTTYYYKCDGAGNEYKFRTPPPVGPEVPIKFALVGKRFYHLADTPYSMLLISCIWILCNRYLNPCRGFGSIWMDKIHPSAHR